MKFALVDNIRTAATKGSMGICPSCGAELTAKCGSLKIHHWAHKAIRNCDPWWENETEWHRKWKSNFPETCQEVITWDEHAKEKDIADVRTNHNLVIEFQHSPIKSRERISREKFYKNMIWVVDGTRLKRDYLRFLKGKNDLRETQKQQFFFVDFPDECFPKAWIESSVPVIFDFKAFASIANSKDPRNFLYCLYPKRGGVTSVLEKIDHTLFLEIIHNGQWQARFLTLMNPPKPALQMVRIIIPGRQFPFGRGRVHWKKRRGF